MGLVDMDATMDATMDVTMDAGRGRRERGLR